MNRIKRTINTLLGIAMLLVLLPTVALAAETATADFTTNPDAALALLGGSSVAEWDRDTTTLTLKGVNFTTSATTAVKLPAGSTIVLADGTTNTITGGNTESDGCYGIYAVGNLTIQGAGTLTVTGGDITAAAGTITLESSGIYANGGLTISGGTINATGGNITRGNSTAGLRSYGIHAESGVAISGGAVTAQSSTAPNRSYGIYAENGNIAVTNSTVTATGRAAYYSYGIDAHAGSVTVENSRVNATGDTAGENGAGIYAKTGVTISGSTTEVTATGGKADNNSYGIEAQAGSITIENSKVTATGGAAGKNGAGIYAKTGVTISGTANVTAEGGKAGNNSYGIEANKGDVTISGSAEVTATGGTATGAYSNSYGIIAISYYNSPSDSGGGNVSISNTAKVTTTGGTATGNSGNSYGISADEDVTISGGTVTAKGSAANCSYGTYVYDDLTISGGTVDAEGGTASSVSYGICVYYGDMTISGSTTKVTAKGGAANVASGDSRGIDARAGSVKIEGGEVKATGGTASGPFSTGISAEKDVTISGGTVTATGSAASSFSYGISAGKNVTISDSAAVTAEGGTTSRESFGIEAYSGSIKITITDGTVTAKAASATKASALSKTPAALPTAYQWRISNSGDYSAYPGSAYTWNAADTYVEIRNVLRTAVTVTGSITANDKTYDGTTAATLKFDSVTLTGVASGDIVSLDTDNVTATFDNKNVGTGKPVTVTGTFDLRGKDAYKYYLTLPGLGSLTANITACTTVTDTTETAQTIYVGEGSSFRAPTFTGAGGEAPTGDVTYTVGSASKTLDEIIAHLNTLTAGETASVDYSFAGTGNYAGASASGTITVTVTSRPAPVIPIVNTYPVTAAQPENGAVTVSPANAAAGVTVTVTVKPDAGHELASLTVTDAGGKTITLTDKGDGKYTFTMPAGKVTVNAAFSRVTLPFVDVPADAYYYDAVAWAVENKITDGTSDITFSPNAPCTRGQIVTFLWRAAGCPEPKSSVNPFTDVEEGAYYSKAVLWAVENGITTGTGDGTTFSPDAPCTRDQTVTFLWRAVEKPAATVGQSFTDVPADAYYASAVQWAVANGVTTGTGNGMFSPDATCTRAQIVTFLYRFFVK